MSRTITVKPTVEQELPQSIPEDVESYSGFEFTVDNHGNLINLDGVYRNNQRDPSVNEDTILEAWGVSERESVPAVWSHNGEQQEVTVYDSYVTPSGYRFYKTREDLVGFRSQTGIPEEEIEWITTDDGNPPEPSEDAEEIHYGRYKREDGRSFKQKVSDFLRGRDAYARLVTYRYRDRDDEVVTERIERDNRPVTAAIIAIGAIAVALLLKDRGGPDIDQIQAVIENQSTILENQEALRENQETILGELRNEEYGLNVLDNQQDQIYTELKHPEYGLEALREQHANIQEHIEGAKDELRGAMDQHFDHLRDQMEENQSNLLDAHGIDSEAELGDGIGDPSSENGNGMQDSDGNSGGYEGGEGGGGSENQIDTGQTFRVGSGNGLTHEIQEYAKAKGFGNISSSDAYHHYLELRGKYGSNLIDLLGTSNDTYTTSWGDVRISSPGAARWPEGVEKDLLKMLGK